ncbi:relaxase domain-containing protein [Streptomyces sp. HO565]|uniref:relaxase domain-containing protein n=1 Tax=Streptomyces sp. HO565 TaxID=2857489 RepID=UPI0038B5B902
MRGPDGRWRNLDSRLLLRDVVAASELFNQRSLELICSRLHLATEEVEVTPGQRPVMRIVDIDARLRAAFAQRSGAVRTTAEAFFDDYRRSHGRQPHGAARHALLEQARNWSSPAKRERAVTATRRLPSSSEGAATAWTLGAVGTPGQPGTRHFIFCGCRSGLHFGHQLACLLRQLDARARRNGVPARRTPHSI